MKRVLSIGLCLAMGVIVACSPTPANQIQKEIDSAPDWYLNPPEDNEEFLYSTASAISSRREVARNKAENDSRANMAFKLESKVEALQKTFSEEITSGQNSNYDEAFTRAAKSIAGTTLRGASPDQIYFAPTQDGRYECFMLFKMPVGDARAMLDNALSRERELYVKFKESKAFEELQKDLSRIGKDN